MRKLLGAFLFVLLIASVVFGQANGKLQLHFIDVGQGDAAILISPHGKTVMFDNGPPGKNCAKALSYLGQLPVSEINYHVASHYHKDHIGCTSELLDKFPLTLFALDRGCSYKSGLFNRYEEAVRAMRMQVSLDDPLVTLDEETDNPVVIEFIAVNGATVTTECENGSGGGENNFSLVAVIKFGRFRAVMGGDLSGLDKGLYRNIERLVAGKMESVDVYKVHHHGSNYSSNLDWLKAIRPKVGIVSVGQNTYGHPVAACLTRLHDAGVKTYWTEKGSGATPQEHDVIGGNIVVEVEPGAEEFKVSYNDRTQTDTYPVH